MGFGSFISHLAAPIVKTLGPAAYVAVPFLGPSLLAAKVIDVGISAVAPSPVKHSSVQAPIAGNVPQPGLQSFYYAAPQYQAPQYPQYSYPQYGGSPWDYSTQLTPFSEARYPTYQVPSTPAGTPRIWEDLVSLAPLFL